MSPQRLAQQFGWFLDRAPLVQTLGSQGCGILLAVFGIHRMALALANLVEQPGTEAV